MSEDLRATVCEILLKGVEGLDRPAAAQALRRREDVTLAELELTSLKTVEVLMEVHDHLGVDLDMEEFDRIETVSDLLTVIGERR